MTTLARLGLFTAVLAVAFAAAVGVGNAVGAVGVVEEPAHDTPDDGDAADAGHDDSGGDTGGHSAGGHDDEHAGDAVKGLSAAADGYALDVLTPVLPLGSPAQLAFRVLGPDGEPVLDYTDAHEKPLHLVVVRRDTTGFQHLHPTLDQSGTWNQQLTLPAAGTYKVFADFAPVGGEPLTLATDVHVPGDYAPSELPRVSGVSTVDGYEVSLIGDLVAGQASELSLTLTKNGVPVDDLQPYLGAYGHLVALRASDLGYLHVHPEDGPAGPQLRFVAEVPTEGVYRLYLDFQHGGVVRTAEFTAATAGVSHDAVPHSHEGES